VQIRPYEGKLQIDATEPGQTVHVLVPLSLLEDVTSQLADHGPGE
jgi:hypothetical protein